MFISLRSHDHGEQFIFIIFNQKMSLIDGSSKATGNKLPDLNASDVHEDILLQILGVVPPSYEINLVDIYSHTLSGGCRCRSVRSTGAQQAN
jgi:hypothetical protein